MLSSLVKNLRDTLTQYANIAIINVSGLVPEFIYYIRCAELIGSLMEKGCVFCWTPGTVPGVQKERDGTPSMKIMVSACLLGQNCKYNGGNNYSEKVAKYLEGHEIIPVCPEIAGGLPTPRIPCEIVNGVVTNKDGESKDKEYRAGAELCLKKALEENIDLAILQSRSPSCGVKQIYDGSFLGKLVEGKGVFAQALVDNGIKVLDLEDV